MANLWRCTTTRPKAHRLHAYALNLWRWRQRYPQVWAIRFNRLTPADQVWAHSTGACESGNDPFTNTGNGYYGAFQWLPSTWHAAGGTGMPNQTTWDHQAVIAVNLMHRVGSGPWPQCG